MGNIFKIVKTYVPNTVLCSAQLLTAEMDGVAILGGILPDVRNPHDNIYAC